MSIWEIGFPASHHGHCANTIFKNNLEGCYSRDGVQCFLSLERRIYRKPSDGGKKSFRQNQANILTVKDLQNLWQFHTYPEWYRELRLRFSFSGLYAACWEAEGGPCSLEIFLSTMITWHVIISQEMLHILCLEKNFLTPAWVENKYVNHTLLGYVPSFSEEKEHEKKWCVSPKERGLCRLSRREKKVLIM